MILNMEVLKGQFRIFCKIFDNAGKELPHILGPFSDTGDVVRTDDYGNLSVIDEIGVALANSADVAKAHRWELRVWVWDETPRYDASTNTTYTGQLLREVDPASDLDGSKPNVWVQTGLIHPPATKQRPPVGPKKKKTP